MAYVGYFVDNDDSDENVDNDDNFSALRELYNPKRELYNPKIDLPS